MDTNLGAALRKVREERGKSLRSVAGAVGISPSLLSQVETGKTQPSVSTLYALVTHLEVSVDALMGTGRLQRPVPSSLTLLSDKPPPSPSDQVVQRAEDNPVIELENGVRWERLAVGSFSGVDPLITTYAPGGSSGQDGRMLRHAGVEYGYILTGELTLHLDFETYELRAGDSVCFDSHRPHLFVNNTDEDAKGMWVVVGRNEAGDPHPDAGSSTAPLRGSVAAFDAIDRLDP